MAADKEVVTGLFKRSNQPEWPSLHVTFLWTDCSRERYPMLMIKTTMLKASVMFIQPV